MYSPRLGLILMFEGDTRVVSVTVANVDAFTAVSGVLKQGDTDVTSTYCSSGTEQFAGNALWSVNLGAVASIPAGNYRYFITGTYDGKVRTWYWDVLVLPKDATYLNEIPMDDYDPFLEEVVIYEGDKFIKEVTFPSLEFAAASGVFKLLNENVTATYCSSSPAYSGGTLTTHNIGGQASIPPGDYGYFITGAIAPSIYMTWYYRVKVLPKSSIL